MLGFVAAQELSSWQGGFLIVCFSLQTPRASGARLQRSRFFHAQEGWLLLPGVCRPVVVAGGLSCLWHVESLSPGIKLVSPALQGDPTTQPPREALQADFNVCMVFTMWTGFYLPALIMTFVYSIVWSHFQMLVRNRSGRRWAFISNDFSKIIWYY